MTHLGTIVHFEGIERYYHEAELGQELVLCLLALLVQKYKYCLVRLFSICRGKATQKVLCLLALLVQKYKSGT